MEWNSEDSVVMKRTRELCQAVLEEPDFQDIRQKVDAFLADEQIRAQYQDLTDRGALLQHRQQSGMPLDMAEIADFEKRRDQFLTHPVAQGFLAAQQAMQNLQESVGQYLAKTFELGRMPQREDFDHGTCGHGCGCSH